MSKNNNVNPGQYKVKGRERPGKDLPELELARQSSSRVIEPSKAQRRRKAPARSPSR